MSYTAFNPATGEPLETVAWMPAVGVEALLADTERAFEEYRHTSLAARAEWMHRLALLLEEEVHLFAETMTREMGKPIRAAEAEVEKCALGCRYFAEHAGRYLAPEEAGTDALRSYVVFQPLGPILAIMPWNFPFWQVFRFAAPALMAGNTVVLKHAPNVPGCARQITELFARAGFPEGVFSNLVVDNDAAGAVIDDPRIRAVTLTGSVRAGRAVAARAGAALKKTVLELGGSDPFVVLADANLDHAARLGVSSRTQNSGQSCIAAKRFILERPVAEAFTARFVERMRALVVGDPAREETEIGPMARQDLLEHLDDQVQRSIRAGARCLTGGRRLDGPGFFYEPTVLAGVRPGMPAFDEELFGPVAALTEAADPEEAIRLANASTYGLGGTVLTGDPARGEELALRLEVGSAFVNDLVRSDPRLPFGGVRQSGYGRELSAFGLREFVNVKTVWIGHGTAPPAAPGEKVE